MMHPELLEPFARTIVGALGAGILESALLAFVIFGLTKLPPRPTATTRHVFWWSALAASVALPLVSIAISFGHVEHRLVVESPSPVITMLQVSDAAAKLPNLSSALRSGPIQPRVEPDPPGVLARVRDALAGINFEFVGVALVTVWLTVSLVGLASLLRSFLTLRALKRNASPLDESVSRRLRRWRHASRFGRAVTLAVSNEVDVPVAVGFGNPTILLPIQVVERESVADIDQIAMHEYAHLNRRDDWTNLIQRFLERLFWFNPIVAFIGRRIALEREIACDDWVVAQTGRAHRYATCLWRLVESSRLPARPILAPGALHSPKQITVRIEQLLDSRRNAPPRLSAFGALSVALLCVALIVFQAQRAPVIALTEKVAPQAATSAAPAHAARPLIPPTQHFTTIVRVAAKARPAARSPQVAVASKVVPSAARPKTAVPPAPTAISIERETLLAVADVPAAPTPVPAPQLNEATPAPAPSGRVERRTLEVRARMMNRADLEALRAELRKSFEQLRTGDDEATRKLRADLRLKIEEMLKQLPELGDGHNQLHLFIPFNDEQRIVIPRVDQPSAPRDVQSIRNCVGCAFPNANLRGVDLQRISMVGTSLHGADLRGSKLAGVRWVGVDLENAILDGSDLRNATFIGCNLRNVSLKNVNLSGSTFERVDFSGARLEGADLSNVKLLGCSLRRANLRGANLKGLVIDNSTGPFLPSNLMRYKFEMPKMPERPAAGYTGNSAVTVIPLTQPETN
jgi:beta-lactamase regulating signal transducer with metallopeptidase domain